MPKAKFKLTDMRKAFSEVLVNPNKCNTFWKIYIETKNPDNMIEDAIVDLKTDNLNGAIRKLGMAKAILGA